MLQLFLAHALALAARGQVQDQADDQPAKENFNYPYLSQSIGEFWRRWHISLGSFFRDYVYIPLGGNRCPVPRQILNLFAVWFLTGLWHGASWNFVLWGLYFGLLIGLKRFLLGEKLVRVPGAVKTPVVFLLVLFSWILFKFTDFSMLAIALKGVGLAFKNNIFFLIFSAVAATPLGKTLRTMLKNLSRRNQVWFWVNGAWEALHPVRLLILSAMALAGDSYNPFLYFQF